MATCKNFHIIVTGTSNLPDIALGIIGVKNWKENRTKSGTGNGGTCLEGSVNLISTQGCGMDRCRENRISGDEL